MKRTGVRLTLSLLSLFCGVEGAMADTLVIRFGSGKVQTVELEEKAKEVREIKINEALPAAVPEAVNSPRSDQKPLKEVSPSELNKKAKNPVPKIEWAPPMSD